MTIKEDFYKIVGLYKNDEIHERISDGIRSYLEQLGFDTPCISFNINIEMIVDESRIAKQIDLLEAYYELISNQLSVAITKEDKEYLTNLLNEVEEVLNKW
jgi:hypothetical protein